MRKIQTVTILLVLIISSAYAISKEEFLKLPYEKRRSFPVVVGISSEYAIPKEEYLKLPFEVRRTISREKAREMVQYAIQSIGEKERNLDVSRLHNLSMTNAVIYKDAVIDYGTVCAIYKASCENHFKAAEYCYKDYLEWKKYDLGQPALWQHPGGDAHPLSRILALYEDYHMYKEWDRLYFDYNDFYWKRAAEIECRLVLPPDPACPQKWLKNNEGYQGFLKEWAEVKKLAKTTKPKPLSVQVQTHEDFYSNDVKKVLGAVEYYAKNRVKFMVEKAAKHKDGVVVKKAIEYLENWKE